MKSLAPLCVLILAAFWCYTDAYTYEVETGYEILLPCDPEMQYATGCECNDGDIGCDQCNTCSCNGGVWTCSRVGCMVEDHTIPWYYDEESGSCEQRTPMEQNNQQQQQQLEQQQQQGQEPNIPELLFDSSPYKKETCCCKCGKDDYEAACQECNNCVCRG